MSELPIPPAQISGLGAGGAIGGIGMAISHVIRQKILEGEAEAIGKREALAKSFEDLTTDPRYNYDPNLVAAAQQHAIRLRTLGMHEKLPKEYQPNAKTGGIPAYQGLILHAHENPPPPPPMSEPPATGPADFDQLFTAQGAQPGGVAAGPGGQKKGPNAISPAPAATAGSGLPTPPPLATGGGVPVGPASAAGLPPPPQPISSSMIPPGMESRGLNPTQQAVAASQAASAGASASIQKQIQLIAQSEGIPESQAAARVFSKLYPHEYVPIGRGGAIRVDTGEAIPPMAPTGASAEPKTPAQLGMQGAMGTIAKKYNTTPDKLDASQQLEAFNLYSSTSSEAKKDPEMVEMHKELMRQTKILNDQKIADAQADADPGDRDVRTTVSGKQYADLTGYSGKTKDKLKAYYEGRGIAALDPKEAESIRDVDTARMNQHSVLWDVLGKLPRDANDRITAAPTNKLKAFLQSDEDLAAFNTHRAMAIQSLRALAGTSLRITMQEVELAIANDIPRITDTIAVAVRKNEIMNEMLTNKESPLLVRNRSALPAPPAKATPPTGKPKTAADYLARP